MKTTKNNWFETLIEDMERRRLRKLRLRDVPQRDLAAWMTCQEERDFSRAKYRSKRVRQLERSYKMIRGQYEEMLRGQVHRCLTCNRGEHELGEPLHVDHCHKTGKVRGLLCRHCNFALGFARDDPQTLRHLAIYAEYHAKKK